MRLKSHHLFSFVAWSVNLSSWCCFGATQVMSTRSGHLPDKNPTFAIKFPRKTKKNSFGIHYYTLGKILQNWVILWSTVKSAENAKNAKILGKCVKRETWRKYAENSKNAKFAENAKNAKVAENAKLQIGSNVLSEKHQKCWKWAERPISGSKNRWDIFSRWRKKTWTRRPELPLKWKKVILPNV